MQNLYCSFVEIGGQKWKMQKKKFCILLYRMYTFLVAFKFLCLYQRVRGCPQSSFLLGLLFNNNQTTINHNIFGIFFGVKDDCASRAVSRFTTHNVYQQKAHVTRLLSVVCMRFYHGRLLRYDFSKLAHLFSAFFVGVKDDCVHQAALWMLIPRYQIGNQNRFQIPFEEDSSRC